MITKEISENAELWFDNIIIKANKVDGVPKGYVSAQGGFILPSNGSTIETVRVSEDVNVFLGLLATKLSLDPIAIYQAICDSLEDTYNSLT